MYINKSQTKKLSLSLLYFGSSAGKESTCNAGDLGSIPGLGRSAGEGIGYPLQYSWASLVAQLVKKICLHCRKPGFNPWVGKIAWRRKRLPTPVFWPGEFHGLYNDSVTHFHFHQVITKMGLFNYLGYSRSIPRKDYIFQLGPNESKYFALSENYPFYQKYVRILLT